MATSPIFSTVPALRILVPFIAGILIHRLWHCWWAPLMLAMGAVVLYMVMALGSHTPDKRLRMRDRYIIPLALFGLSLGWICAVIHCPSRLNEAQCNNRLLTGQVTDLNFTDFSMQMTIEVLDDDLPPCRVLVSTRGCDYTMRVGDLVAWQAKLTEVGKAGNPGELDYADYLLDSHGIRYEQHLPLKQILRVGHHPTLASRLSEVRHGLQQQVFNSRLSPAAQHFVVALLLGNRQMIDQTTREEFTAAGVAHVLALSGLHVGFIALILWWLLFPLDYLGLKKLRLVITLAGIVLFAVFTGMSPSVVRATVMIGFVFASMLFYRRSVSLNALALAALTILLFTPSALYSVGFQLSFITVAAMLLFAHIPGWLTSRHKLVNRFTSTIIVSLIAMLATVALSAHYFHNISLMSVLANLLILPVMPIFMTLGALFLLVTMAGLHWPMLDRAIDAVYQYIHWSAQTVGSMPMSHVKGVYVSTFGAVAYFFMIGLLFLWLYCRNHRYLWWATGTLAVMWLHSVYIDYTTPDRGMVVLNSFTSTPIVYFDHGKGVVWAPDDEETDSASFSRYYAGFLARHNIGELQFVAGDSVVSLDEALFKPPYAHLMGQRILAAGAGKWRHATAGQQPMELDLVIATKRFHGMVSKLRELYQFDTLIITGAMYPTTLAPLLQECDSLGIPYHNLLNQGAYVLTRQQ